MKPSAHLRFTLWLVGVMSRIVPGHARSGWRLEWEGELVARHRDLVDADRLTGAARLDLIRRSLGSGRDALNYWDVRMMMKGFVEDFVRSARGLTRRPGFTGIVVGTLAVGIGVSTSIFGVARDVLLRPFPYQDADRVVSIQSVHTERAGFFGNVTYPNLSDLAERATSFDQVALIRWWQPALEQESGAIVVRGGTVTSNYFSVFGMEPGLGRFFRTEEQGPGAPRVVVLSHDFWTERFAADPGVVGRTLRLNGEAFEVIGVTSADFEDPWLLGGPGSEPGVWRTVASPPGDWPRSGRSWRGIGRLREGVELATAQTETSAIFAALEEQYPEHNAKRSLRILPLQEVIAGPSRPVLLVLLGSVGLLLLIACANLANLMLGRALDRHAEFALQRALGASNTRIVGQSLSEAFILAFLGGGLGLGIAFWVGTAARGATALLPRPVTGTVDPTLIAVGLGLTAGCALLFGTAPAVHALRSGGDRAHAAGTRTLTSGRRGQRLRRGLVVGQLALTAFLLIGSGLLSLSLRRLGATELGLVTEGVVGVELHGSAWWDLDGEAAGVQWRDVMDRVRAVPGVAAVGAMDYLPLSDGYSCDGVRRADEPPPEAGEGDCAEVRSVLGDLDDALGIELVRGRFLTADDRLDAPPVTVIDEALAELLWPGQSPIGERVAVHTREHEVVGVVRDLKHFGPGQEQRPMLYLHAAQEGWNGAARGLELVVRLSSGGDVAAVRRAVHDVNGSIAIGAVTPLDDLLRANLAPARFRARLMGAFAGTALVLALLGIAGVMLYSVSRRTRELGVRLALGARPEEVRDLVMKEGAGLIVLGTAIGVGGAFAISRVLQSMLFEVTTADPLVYGSVVVFLVASAAIACYVPARRAARVDPLRALASE